MKQSVKELLTQATKALQAYENPKSEAQILLCHVLDQDKLWLMTHEDSEVSTKPFLGLVERRVKGEPIEYITQKVSFYSEQFYIAPGALIPRPETELLIDEVLKVCHKEFSGHIVEIGTGSGIISIMLALHLPKARFTAIDIAKEALEIAKINCEAFDVLNRIRLIEGNLLDGVDEPIDLLVSNPPYIKERELLEKPLSFEPQNALFGGIVGDEILKNILLEADQRAIAFVACEMGYDQKASMQAFINGLGNFEVKFYEDLAGFDRGFVAQRKKNA